VLEMAQVLVAVQGLLVLLAVLLRLLETLALAWFLASQVLQFNTLAVAVAVHFLVPLFCQLV